MSKKKNLVFVNENEVKNTKRKIEFAEKLLNQFFENTIEIIGELPKEKVQDFPKNAVMIIREELKSRFQFLGADEEFNLRAMGINPEPLYKEFQKNVDSWSKYEFEFIGNEFKAKEIQPEIEKWYCYADTPEKQKVIEIANELLKSFEELKHAGLVTNPTTFKNSFNITLFTCSGNEVSINNKLLPELFSNIDRGLYKIKLKNK